MAETALMKKEPVVSLVKSHGAIILADQLATVTEQRGYLVKFVHENLREGVDYGTIPGTPKPCLYKPGAEKLTDLYRCTAELEVDKEAEDWDKGFFYYRFRARIVSRETGVCLGVGIGSCNSRETKYRWRDAKLKCPTCSAETLFKSKDKPEWYCWTKKGGCGATFPEKDPKVVDQPRGRVENPDVADLVNTIQKMATKRAHVAAALQLAGCSDLFTQDLEDMPFEQPPLPAVESRTLPRNQTIDHRAPPPPSGARAGDDLGPTPEDQAAYYSQMEPEAQQPAPPAPDATSGGGADQRRARRVFMAKKLPDNRFLEWVAIIIGKPKPAKDWTPLELSELERAVKEGR